MCGIAGIIFKSRDRVVESAQVSEMLGSISHRGPDGQGVYVKGHVGIGMARLSIIDSNNHNIPYPNHDGTMHIAYNGEVYNHVEISRSLNTDHAFRQGSDAETIMQGWEERGEKILNELNGMYAFALYDERTDRLVVARDKAGEKPLYYYEDNEKVVFASEIKAIVKVVQCEINPSPVSYRAFEFTCGVETLFKDVSTVEPGCYLEVQNGKVQSVTYWRAWDDLIELPDDEDKLVNHLAELLEDSILMRTRNTCHQLGCLVSGGVDSALVACIAKPDFIYSGNYDINDDFNELPYAQLVADQIGKELVVVKPTKDDYLQYRDEILYHLDMPATWTSFNIYMVLRRASEDIRVILSGEGADELFGGYHRYHLLNHDQQIYELQAMEKYDYLIQKYYGTPAARYARLINRNENDFDQECWEYLNQLTQHYFKNFDGVVHGMGVTDFYTTMQVLLTMADRMSMAFSVENRSPLLDHRLIQFAYSLPEKYKIKNGITKYIFKEAAKKFIPHEIAERKDKRGFVAPVNIWFGWGKSGKFSREEYKNEVMTAWKNIFFGNGPSA